MEELEEKRMEWCKNMAVLSVDVLVDSKLVTEGKFDETVDIVAQELYIQVFLMNDYPPPFDMKFLK